MKVFEERETKVVTGHVCVSLKCDACGSVAEYPEDQAWSWGGAGVASAHINANYTIDGEFESTEADLCYDCSTKLIALAKTGRLKDLLAGVQVVVGADIPVVAGAAPTFTTAVVDIVSAKSTEP